MKYLHLKKETEVLKEYPRDNSSITLSREDIPNRDIKPRSYKRKLCRQEFNLAGLAALLREVCL